MAQKKRILIELRVPKGMRGHRALARASALRVPTLELDASYDPIPVPPVAEQAERLRAAGEEIIVVRGVIEQERLPELEAQPGVVRVWQDAPIAPFTSDRVADGAFFVQLVAPGAFGTCPVPPCDCDIENARGTLADVAEFLGVNRIWSNGFRGQGIGIGIVDGGIRAIGRTPDGVIDRVIGGWPEDWGTKSSDWGGHGDMTSTDALGMAPDATIFDIRIAGGDDAEDFISNALAGFNWAIGRYQAIGVPNILSNSWGIFQESWAPDYATDPTHVFTRKVVEAIATGILVLFAAGNCGERCPSGRCSGDVGPGRSIWGANGHPRVMTVGAGNVNNQLIGYSSQGPAALATAKPDFLAPSHFQGFFPVDTGTSAACPVAAGTVATLKSAFPWLSQQHAKEVLQATARDIGPSGWDPHSGFGMVRPYDAFERLAAAFHRVHDLGLS